MSRGAILPTTLLLILLVACAAPATLPTNVSRVDTSTPTTLPPTTTSAELATAEPTEPPILEPVALPATTTPTEAPFALATAPGHIPQIDNWYIFNPSYVATAEEDNALVLTLRGRALWFMQDRGVLVCRLVQGNFRTTATVRASKASDPSQPPEGPVVQLGGRMARSPLNNGQENYVFIVVGFDTNDLSVETKTTTDSVSKWDCPSWGSAEAELALCRVGATFNLYKRPMGGTDWELAKSFERSDLPDTLQVGPNIYSDGKPDLQVRYAGLEIEPVKMKQGVLQVKCKIWQVWVKTCQIYY